MIKITHLMPVKDGLPYLSTILKAISENANNHDEVIIINDGSSDGTLHFLQKNSFQLPNVRIITTKGIGIVKALNLGIAESNNTWIARYDVDDVYASKRIATQRALISDKTAAIFCDYELILQNGRSTGIIPSAVDNLATIVSLLFSQQTPHPAVIMNKEYVLAAGGYIFEDFPAEDLSLWLRISRYGELISSPEVLFKYRISKTSTSGSRQNEVKNKKFHLLNYYGLPIEFIRQNLNQLTESFYNYDQLNFVYERKLLLKRNIHALHRIYPNINGVSRISYPSYALSHPITTGKLFQQKMKRLIFRKL